MNTDTRGPREIDAELASAHTDYRNVARLLADVMKQVHRVAGDKGRWDSRRARTIPTMTDREALDAARARLAADGTPAWEAREIQNALDRHTFLTNQAAEARARIADLDSEYTGWSRFFLVTSSQGHIHSSTHCSTCQPTTEFAWLPDMSGRTEADCVAEHGALLCTVCFPSAPVEWTNQRELEQAAKAAERCPGSGTYMDASLPSRTGRYRGNWATCPSCRDHITITSTGKLRAHKAK